MWSRISNYLIYVWFYIDYIRVELLQKFITATHISYIDIFGSVEFVLKKLTVEEFKCLVFVRGLKSETDSDVRTRLITVPISTL